MKGEIVQFTYKGVVFQVKPEKKQSKLEKLVGQPVVAAGVDLEQASKQLLTEMEAEWSKDWAKLFASGISGRKCGRTQSRHGARL